jgi:transposase
MNPEREREQRGLEIAALLPIQYNGETYTVPSQSNGNKYQVDANPQAIHCDCPDFGARGRKCKHVYAVEFVIRRERSVTQTASGDTTITETVTETIKLRYKQEWPAYNSAQVNEKAMFLSLLYELCAGIDEPIQTMGRPRLTMADMIFSSTYKVYSTVSARRFMTDLKEAFVRRYIARVPCYNSIINYLEMEELTPYLKRLIVESSLPLKAIETDFAVDASGFSASKYNSWYSAKYGKEMNSQDWIKVHLMCGVKTNIVTSVEISGAHLHDTNMFAPLVNATAKNFELAEVSADKAYSNKANLTVVENKGAKPYIDFRKNTKPTGKVDIWHRMFHYYQMNREEFYQRYHKRSNVESTFSMIKAKFGSALRSKTFTAQANEALCKILCHNLCVLVQSSYELGIDASFWTE